MFECFEAEDAVIFPSKEECTVDIITINGVDTIVGYFWGHVGAQLTLVATNIQDLIANLELGRRDRLIQAQNSVRIIV